ncbi:MAG: MFS transporter [Gemmatimonadota bacterium]
MSPTVSQRDQFRQLAILIAVNAVDMIGFAIVLPLLPFYALDFHATPVQIGWLMAAFSVAQLLASPFWGRVSDRYGRRPALLIGLTASALAYIVFGLANSLWMLFLSRLVQGAGGGTTGVVHAYVGDTMRPADRARALGWLSAATSAGIAIGPIVGSLSSAGLGHSSPGFVAAGLCLLNVGFAWKWLPESKPTAGPGDVTPKPRTPIWHTAWIVISRPRGAVSRLVLIYAVGMLAFTCMTSIVALFLNAQFQVTEKTIGYFFTYIGILSFVMRSIFLGPVVDRVGEAWAMRLGAACMVVGLILYAMAPTIWLLVLVIPLVPIGTALLFPATTSLMTRTSDKAELGTTMGTAQTFAGISRVVAPLAATFAFQHYGHRSPFFMGAGLVALVSLLAFRVAHQPAPVTPLPVRES